MGRIRPRTSAKSTRIINAILKAEWEEPNAWERDSYTIARMTVANASKTVPDPWNRAFWDYFGTTLSKALKQWEERSRRIEIELERCRQMVQAKAAQPKQMQLDFSAPALPPKKRPQSVKGENQPWKKKLCAGDRVRSTQENSVFSLRVWELTTSQPNSTLTSEASTAGSGGNAFRLQLAHSKSSRSRDGTE